jgi:hypothetical protein
VFDSITAGAGSVTVDIGTGSFLGLQGLTVVSASNANVTIPAFPIGTFDPVTATFIRPNPSDPVDFTLRATSRINTVLIRAQCPGAARSEQTARTTGLPVWMPKQTTGSLDGLISLVYYVFGTEGA